MWRGAAPVRRFRLRQDASRRNLCGNCLGGGHRVVVSVVLPHPQRTFAVTTRPLHVPATAETRPSGRLMVWTASCRNDGTTGAARRRTLMLTAIATSCSASVQLQSPKGTGSVFISRHQTVEALMEHRQGIKCFLMTFT